MRRLPIALLLIALFHLPQAFTQQTSCPAGLYLYTVNNSCVASCPTFSYIGTQGSQAACLPQQSITTRIHPTSEERTYVLVFDAAPVPFADAATFEQQVTVLSSENHGLIKTTYPLTATFLNDLKTIVRFSIVAPEISAQATYALQIPDFSTNNQSQSYIALSRSFKSLHSVNFPPKIRLSLPLLPSLTEVLSTHGSLLPV